MNEYVIDIGVEVEDTYINNDVEWMAKSAMNRRK